MTNPLTQFSGPEDDFMIACLASELLDQPVALSAPADLDWQKVNVLLQKNRLAAHFYSLGLKHPGLFPETIRGQLRQARYANLLYGDQCRQEVAQVLGALKTADIPVIVMKGWALIQWLYEGDHGQRFCEDIDILVSPDKIDLVEETLRKLNYAGVDEVQPGYTRRFTNARAYTLAGEHRGPFRKFSIGLHWGLTHYPYYDEKRINIAELFERARPLQVAGVDAFELSFEDQLIYTCAHLALHHRNEETLLNYFEIAAIIQRAGKELNWQFVVERSKTWRYLVQVQHVLRQVNRFWPGIIPAGAFAQIQHTRPSWTDQMIDRLVANTKGNQFRSAVVEFLAMPGINNKFSAAYHQIFPDKEYMLTRYQPPEKRRLFWLYAVRMNKAIRGIFQS